MEKYIPIAAMVTMALGACASVPATSAEVESCRKMESDMGLGTRHDHQEMKGMGLNPMNISHSRCMEILGRTQ
jgi:hypothetical protein